MEKWKEMGLLLNYYFWQLCRNFPYYCNTIYLIIIIIIIIIIH